MGLLISDYIISAGNKENNAGLNINSIAVDRKSINNHAMNHDTTIASYGVISYDVLSYDVISHDVIIYDDEDAVSDSIIKHNMIYLE